MPAPGPIGIRIKKRRQVLRLSQEELAAKLGVSKSTVANWERGKHFPLRHLGAVEDVLGISLDEEAAAGSLADLLPAQDDWEAEVLSDPDLSDEWRRELITASRDARAEYQARKAAQRPPGRAAG